MQFTAMKGSSEWAEWSWIARAMTSLPVPVSPRTRTVARFRASTPAETRRALEESGAPSWRVDLVLDFYAGFERGLGAATTDAVLELTGRPPGDLEAFVRDHAGDFGSP